MTPREYVAAQCAAAPAPPDVHDARAEEELREHLKQVGLNDPKFDVAAADYPSFLLENVWPGLPLYIRNGLETGRIAVGEVESHEPNAFTVPVGDGHAIIINAGLPRFIYRVTRILASRFTMDEHGPSTEFPETVRLIAEAFWWLEGTGRVFGPDYPVTTMQIMLAARLTDEAMAFLLLHEIGHALRHEGLDLSWSGVPLPSDSPEWREEYAADIIAVATIIQRFKLPEQYQEIILAYGGAELALQIYRALHELGIRGEATHPPAIRRLAFVRAYAQARCASPEVWESLSSCASAIDGLFQRIVETVKDPHQHEAFFASQADAVINELDQALEACSGGFVPNYWKFRQLAGEILQRGYPHAVWERMRDVAADFVAVLEAGKPAAGDGSWEKFQKLKLLNNFVENSLAEPARSIFREALRL
jgi:Zn-dependent peptidase ImmA (M78 family)